ncbi:hypothetical protein [Mumia zhuanghuii]|uniref:hypothetical protein n=1 Tax=Mumia zhuanghuii TaxID=2585211 RepID=UPI00363251D3
MQYGIYVAGRAGTTSAKPDRPERIASAVDDLTGGSPHVIREYIHFLGADPDPEIVRSLGAGDELAGLTMPDQWYLQSRRELDLVVSYLPSTEDISGWLAFLDAVLQRYGHIVRYLQVTLEPNFPIPLIDGSSPGVMEALVQGLPHAKRAAPAHVQVGFSVAEPADWLGGDDEFWQMLANLPAEQFADYVDYVGLGLYPDAFSPIPPEAVPALTENAVRHLRLHSLAAAKIPHRKPIHIAEFGSPSGNGRTAAAQARSITHMVATLEHVAEELNITVCEYFGLRDADTSGGQAVGTLGLLDDDYIPKGSFDIYRGIVRAGATGRDQTLDRNSPTH